MYSSSTRSEFGATTSEDRSLKISCARPFCEVTNRSLATTLVPISSRRTESPGGCPVVRTVTAVVVPISCAAAAVAKMETTAPNRAVFHLRARIDDVMGIGSSFLAVRRNQSFKHTFCLFFHSCPTIQNDRLTETATVVLFCLKFGKFESTCEWVTPTPSDNCFVRGIFVCTRKSHFLSARRFVGDTAG